ncbi:hypothetical protein [Jannaschia formosa]|uniref:hypothetical protein n=1 Tax=Jannaschia formosa TaxID=2259592 RepID=UPI000E1C2E6E|nr:hypothetical protein [Jannaschia formosa]TFL18635.1 hypothetical protein DR046_09165 [Jannaschia formosa]
MKPLLPLMTALLCFGTGPALTQAVAPDSPTAEAVQHFNQDAESQDDVTVLYEEVESDGILDPGDVDTVDGAAVPPSSDAKCPQGAVVSTNGTCVPRD